jgi:hypothetical protein
LHRLIQPEVDLCQELAIDVAEFRVIPFALSQGLLGPLEIPALPIAQAHHPPVVQPATLGLHELKSLGILLADFNLDLLTQ